MELNNFVGEQIKKWRLVRNMNQEELAERLNTTKQTVSRYEKGERKANQDVLFELAKILNVSINEFFPKTENESDKKIETLAAHIDDDVTEDEMEEIRKYIEFIKMKRK
ncbi:helix-turn-helix domain-containing protein [Psychrobacillus psychrodurans]|uniref:helix-turn-helix domain-containing protein n=1 Tax=Psychrobacillus psychrodurans TaxID=126157 RepID=UPI003CFC5E37